jgi:hypothetical protein
MTCHLEGTNEDQDDGASELEERILFCCEMSACADTTPNTTSTTTAAAEQTKSCGVQKERAYQPGV